MSHSSVSVRAAANIALIKYWGKQKVAGNLPAAASLSVGLEDLRTTTHITFNTGQADLIKGLDEPGAKRVEQFLQYVRQTFEAGRYFSITTDNNFPTGAGLASSASGFAALALGLNELLDIGLSSRALSQLARRGSGSAARSIHGGWVEMVAGPDAYATPIMPAAAWAMEVIIAITSTSAKPLGSSEAMLRTSLTSPFYKAWLNAQGADMQAAKQAISDRDFMKLADISEHNCLKMHATIMAARPAILYWLPATLAVAKDIARQRQAGLAAFYTIDAGPQVKVFCLPEAADQVEALVRGMPGVTSIIRTRLGGEPEINTA